MKSELPRPIASYNRRRPGLHTRLLVVYHSLGVYVHHRQAGKISPPGGKALLSKLMGTQCFLRFPVVVSDDVSMHMQPGCVQWPSSGWQVNDYTAMVERQQSGGNASTCRKPCPSATLSTTNSTWILTILGLCSGPRDDRPETNRIWRGLSITDQRHSLPRCPKHVTEIADLLPRAALFNSS